jgi:hypothetical protein
MIWILFVASETWNQKIFSLIVLVTWNWQTLGNFFCDFHYNWTQRHCHWSFKLHSDFFEMDSLSKEGVLSPNTYKDAPQLVLSIILSSLVSKPFQFPFLLEYNRFHLFFFQCLATPGVFDFGQVHWGSQRTKFRSTICANAQSVSRKKSKVPLIHFLPFVCHWFIQHTIDSVVFLQQLPAFNVSSSLSKSSILTRVCCYLL